MEKKLRVFLSGILAGILIMGCGTAALAAGDFSLTFRNLGLTINEKAVIQPGEGVQTSDGQEIPSSIVYTGEAGTETVYMPIQTVGQLLDIPVFQQDGVVYLGLKPDSGTATITLGKGEDAIINTATVDEDGNVTDTKKADGTLEDSLWVKKPLHHAGTTAGRFAELEPYWPEEYEIITYSAIEKEMSGTLVLKDQFKSPVRDEGGWCSLSVTNHSQVPLVLSVSTISTITKDSFPNSVVPAGETVVRTFRAEEYTGGLHQPDLSFSLRQDTVENAAVEEISAVVSLATYDPTFAKPAD